MTQDKNTELTPEEQAELTENMPVLLEAIAKGSPAAPGWLASWRNKRSVGEEAKEQAKLPTLDGQEVKTYFTCPVFLRQERIAHIW